MTPIEGNEQDWEDLARLDPLWAISSKTDKQFNKWDLDDFFSIGEKLSQELMEQAQRVEHPLEFGTALDFGCGVGRVSRFLSKKFKECYGVDISETMIDLARQYNEAYPNCTFTVNTEQNLALFPSNYFDLIYSRIVLQHISEQHVIKCFIREFVRILRPGGLLYFQLPTRISVQGRVRSIQRLYSVLRSLGVSKHFLYNKLKLHPMVMNYLPESEVTRILDEEQAEILEIDPAPMGKFESNTYLVTK